LSIRIYYDEIRYRIKGWRKIRSLVEKVILEEGKIPGDLNFIFTDDESLRKINIEFLKHNYYTDVISFGNIIEGMVSGEIYISIDTVRKNAINYNISLTNEVIRVIIHGSLHLCGYEDRTAGERNVMETKENFWLDKGKEYGIQI
jgi:probable rRNA maturation factor